MIKSKFYILFITVAVIFANNSFNIIDNVNDQTVISFNLGSISFEEIEGYHKIQSGSKASTDNIGEPEIPTYSFNYAVERNKQKIGASTIGSNIKIISEKMSKKLKPN